MMLLLDSALNSQKEKKSIEASSIPPLNADVVTLLGHTSYLTSLKRREFLKPDIAQAYQSVCSKSNPVTTCLFGDELPKHIMKIGEVNKIAKRTMSRSTVSSKRNSDYKSNNSCPRYTQRGGRRVFRKPKQSAFLRKKSINKSVVPSYQNVQGLKRQSITQVPKITSCYAGNLMYHISNWRNLTSDPWVLETIAGYHLEFESVQIWSLIRCK